MKLRNQINDLEHKDEKTLNQNSKKEKRIKKENKDKLRSLWDNFKSTNVWIIGVLEGEREQVIGNLFGKIMKENFPNVV